MENADDRGSMPIAVGWVITAMVVAGACAWNTKSQKFNLADLLEPNKRRLLGVSAIVAILALCATPWAVHPLSPAAGKVSTELSFISLTLLSFSFMVIAVTVFPQLSVITIPVLLFLYYTYVVGQVEHVSKTCFYTSTAMYLGGIIFCILQYFTRTIDNGGIEALVEHVRTLYKTPAYIAKLK
jgi:hypothetical protein